MEEHFWELFEGPVGAPGGSVGTPQGPNDLDLDLKEANLAPSAANYAHLDVEMIIFGRFQSSGTLDFIPTFLVPVGF